MKMAQANRDSRRLHMSFTATGRVSEQAVHDKDAWTLDRVNGQRKKSEDAALYSNLVFGRETVDRESQAKVPE